MDTASQHTPPQMVNHNPHRLGNPFFPMVQQLRPDFNFHFRHMQIAQCPLFDIRLRDVIRQKRKPCILLHQRCNQPCIPADKNRLNLQGMCRKLLIQHTAVAHALFRLQKRLLHQFHKRNGIPCRQGIACRTDKMHPDAALLLYHIIRIVNMVIQRIHNIRISLVL